MQLLLEGQAEKAGEPSRKKKGELDIKIFLCCYFHGTTGWILKTRTPLFSKVQIMDTT
jgi:hypothetical protein